MKSPSSPTSTQSGSRPATQAEPIQLADLTDEQCREGLLYLFRNAQAQGTTLLPGVQPPGGYTDDPTPAPTSTAPTGKTGAGTGLATETANGGLTQEQTLMQGMMQMMLNAQTSDRRRAKKKRIETNLEKFEKNAPKLGGPTSDLTVEAWIAKVEDKDETKGEDVL